MNQELQQKYFEYQVLDQQVKQMHHQLTLMQQQITELVKLGEAIEEISKVKDKTKLFCPLGGGVFVEAELTKKDRVLVNIGADTAAFKSPVDAKKSVDEQIKEINDVISKLESELSETVVKQQELQQDILKAKE